MSEDKESLHQMSAINPVSSSSRNDDYDDVLQQQQQQQQQLSDTNISVTEKQPNSSSNMTEHNIQNKNPTINSSSMSSAAVASALTTTINEHDVIESNMDVAIQNSSHSDSMLVVGTSRRDNATVDSVVSMTAVSHSASSLELSLEAQRKEELVVASNSRHLKSISLPSTVGSSRSKSLLKKSVMFANAGNESILDSSNMNRTGGSSSSTTPVDMIGATTGDTSMKMTQPSLLTMNVTSEPNTTSSTTTAELETVMLTNTTNATIESTSENTVPTIADQDDNMSTNTTNRSETTAATTTKTSHSPWHMALVSIVHTQVRS
jgi:hypothetical protein